MFILRGFIFTEHFRSESFFLSLFPLLGPKLESSLVAAALVFGPVLHTHFRCERDTGGRWKAKRIAFVDLLMSWEFPVTRVRDS